MVSRFGGPNSPAITGSPNSPFGNRYGQFTGNSPFEQMIRELVDGGLSLQQATTQVTRQMQSDVTTGGLPMGAATDMTFEQLADMNRRNLIARPGEDYGGMQIMPGVPGTPGSLDGGMQLMPGTPGSFDSRMRLAGMPGPLGTWDAAQGLVQYPKVLPPLTQYPQQQQPPMSPAEAAYMQRNPFGSRFAPPSTNVPMPGFLGTGAFAGDTGAGAVAMPGYLGSQEILEGKTYIPTQPRGVTNFENFYVAGEDEDVAAESAAMEALSRATPSVPVLDKSLQFNPNNPLFGGSFSEQGVTNITPEVAADIEFNKSVVAPAVAASEAKATQDIDVASVMAAASMAEKKQKTAYDVGVKWDEGKAEEESSQQSIEFAKGYKGKFIEGTTVPIGWNQISQMKKPNGEPVIPPLLQAYWHENAIESYVGAAERGLNRVNQQIKEQEAFYEDLLKPPGGVGGALGLGKRSAEELKQINDSHNARMEALNNQKKAYQSVAQNAGKQYSKSYDMWKNAYVNKTFTLPNSQAWQSTINSIGPGGLENARKGITIPSQVSASDFSIDKTTKSGMPGPAGAITTPDGAVTTPDGTVITPPDPTTGFSPINPQFPGSVSEKGPLIISESAKAAGDFNKRNAAQQRIDALREGQSGALPPGAATQGTGFAGTGATVPGTAMTYDNLRNMLYGMQDPYSQYSRLGLGGQLVTDAQGQPLATTGLSQFGQQGVQDYFNRVVQPRYALSLGQAAAQREAGQAPEFKIGFEQFAQGSPGLGRLTPEQLTAQRDALISTLQDQSLERAQDPYRQELLGYLGNLEDPGNQRLIGALAAPTLGQLSPYFRQAAAQRIGQQLQNAMALQPERSLLSLFGGTPASSTADYLSSAGMSALNQPITGSQSFMTDEEKAKTSRELK